MSPEKTPPSTQTPNKPGLIEVPDWNHHEAEQSRTFESSSLIAEAEDLDPLERVKLLTGFLDDIEALTLRGELTNSRGEPYSLDVIRANMSVLVKELNNPTGVDALRLMPRSNGLRQAVEDLLRNEATAGAFMESINLRSMEASSRLVAAEDLGETALNVAGIKSPNINSVKTVESADTDAFNALAIDVQDEIRLYRQAQQYKRESERSKDFAQAADDGRYLYDVRNGLSPSAKEHLKL